MTMIYFGGRLDTPIKTINGIERSNPDAIVSIRGYDQQGNLLSTIRYEVIKALYQQYSDPFFYTYFDATLPDGTPVVANNKYTYYSGLDGVPVVYPIALAALPNGRVFALSNAIDDAYVNGVQTQVFVGGVRQYNRNGDRIPFPELGGAKSLCVDNNGYLYLGRKEYGAARTIISKYSGSGVLQWSVAETGLETTTVIAVAYDAGAIYALGFSGTYGVYGMTGGWLAKYDAADGSLLWKSAYNNTATISDYPTAISINSSGRIYTAGVFLPVVEWNPGDGAIIHQSSAINDNLNSIEYTALTVTATHVFAASQYYSGSNPDNYKIFNLDLTLYSSSTFNAALRGLVCDQNHHIYAATGRLPSGIASTLNYASLYAAWHFYSHDLDFVQRWGQKTATWSQGLDKYGLPWSTTLYATDLSDSVYRSYAAMYDVRKYFTYTGIETGPDFLNNNPSDFWSVYAVAVVEHDEIPALRMPLCLKAPTTIGDLYANCPGLALGFALKAPDILRDYAGAYAPQVFYRLLIADAAGAVELPCSSLHCRFTVGYVNLSVVVPGVSAAQADAVADKASGAIVVYRGFRLSNGMEQMDEWVRAEIIAIRTDAGSERQPISIDAEKETLANPKTRVLKGLSYRASNSGKRRARGTVDVYLRPMDTLDIGGGETFIVGELVCQVDADGAVMDVTEYLE